MARRRMIDPSFWDDSGIGSLSVHARLLFVSLVSHADDEGRLEADGRNLRRLTFGFDDFTVDQVEGWLAEIISKLRSVAVYGRDGRRYIQLLNWQAFQTINRPTPSRLPSPDSDGCVTIQPSLTEDSLRTHGAITEDSLLREEKGSEANRARAREEQAPCRTSTRQGQRPTGVSDLFDAVLAAMALDPTCSQASWSAAQRVVSVYASKGRTADYVKRQAEWFRTEHWKGRKFGEPPRADDLLDTALQFEAATAPAAPKPKPPTPPPEVLAQVEAKRNERIAKDTAMAAKRQALRGGAA